VPNDVAADWLFHPTDETIDLAAIAIDHFAMADFLVYRLCCGCVATPEIIATEGIGIGDEVYVTGLFSNHSGEQRNILVVRVGNIAAMPEEKVHVTWKDADIDAYLIELRSIGGLSGSPVFVHLGQVKFQGGVPAVSQHRGGQSFFLGIIHGHFNVRVPDSDMAEEDYSVQPKVHTGLGIVIPAAKVMEVIDQPIFIERRAERLREHHRSYSGVPDSKK
jgi:hypothetical protein